MIKPYGLNDKKRFEKCNLCPRNCLVNRWGIKSGFCNTDSSFNIASITVHFGEEPAISGDKGICNVFFTRCNMQCIYCQNYQISRNRGEIIEHTMEYEDVLDKIEYELDRGVRSVGFVSPSHVILQVKAIINGLRRRGRKPIFVFNTNAYDKVSILEEIKELIDVYLPDFKYMDRKIASQYSKTPGYPEIAQKAILTMFRQKGERVIFDERGVARSGLIIRHLVLPGHIENSKKVLRFIAEQLSNNVYISVMSQYTPTQPVLGHPLLGRRLYKWEYEEVLEEMNRLGFKNGWVQNLYESDDYMPDFSSPAPFEFKKTPT